MKRIIGFIFFMIAVGMTLMLLLANRLIGILFVMLFIALGYKLFFC